jgi:hypothetical protein
MGRSVQSYVPHSVMGLAEYDGSQLGSKVCRSKAVVSHISRNTSEMWGTLGFVAAREGLPLLAKLFRCLDEGFDQRRVIKPSDGNGYL